MPKYAVKIKEIWIQYHEVEANNPQEAREAAYHDEGEAFDSEFIGLLDESTWEVKEIK